VLPCTTCSAFGLLLEYDAERKINQQTQEIEDPMSTILPAKSPPTINADATNSIVSWSEMILNQRNALIWNSELSIVSGFHKVFAEILWLKLRVSRPFEKGGAPRVSAGYRAFTRPIRQFVRT